MPASISNRPPPALSLWSVAMMLAVCLVSGGATCARRPTVDHLPPPPAVFNQTPTLEEITQVVNRTAGVQQLSSNTATLEVLSMPKVPRLRATLNLERPKRFRLRANLPIVLGAGIDLGSNEETFWFEVPEGVSKTLYYARHDEYRQQMRRAILPVDPTWIMDALGLVQIDPASVVAGPVVRSDGKLEIRSTVPMPAGAYQRVCLIEPSAGYVTDQFLYGPDGNLIAQSTAAKHVYYPEQQCSLPHEVELHLAPAVGPPLSMRIEVGSYALNQLLSGDPQLFTMPTAAPQAVDLTTLSGAGQAIPSSTPATPIGYRMGAAPAPPLRGATH